MSHHLADQTTEDLDTTSEDKAVDVIPEVTDDMSEDLAVMSEDVTTETTGNQVSVTYPKDIGLWPDTINHATIKYWAECGSESIQHSNSDFSSSINANRSCTNKMFIRSKANTVYS